MAQSKEAEKRRYPELIQMLRTQKILILLFLILLGCKKEPNGSDKSSIFAVDPLGSSLPYLVVQTDETIQNEPKVPGTLTVYVEGKEQFKTTIGIEYRGSTSYRLSDKKSYGVETWDEAGEDVSVSLLDFPEEEDWILMGHVYRASTNTIFDPTLMHHYLGYELSRAVGRYASRGKYVELEVNGDYKGAYIFMEKLKRDKNRIDIKKLDEDDTDPERITGGYILKIDKTSGSDVAADQPLEYYENNWDDDAKYSEYLGFRSQFDIFGNPLSTPPFGPPYHAEQYLETYFLYEHPKAEDITAIQKEYIQNYILNFEKALLEDDFESETRTYTDYIDLESFADYFILNELTGNIDAYRLSTYLHKDRDGLLKMGPLWDLNIGYGRQGRVPVTDWIANYNNYIDRDAWMVPFWWPRLLQDPVFRNTVKNRWQEYRQGALNTSNVLGKVDQTANSLIDNGLIDRNYTRWTGISVDYEESVNALKTYLSNRLDWMDSTIGGF